MKIIINGDFKVGIINKMISGFVELPERNFPFSYKSEGFFKKNRELKIDGEIIVFSTDRKGVFRQGKKDLSFDVKSSIVEGLTLFFSNKIKLTARGVLISYPDKNSFSDIIFRTDGSRKGVKIYQCMLKKTNLFVFYTKISEFYYKPKIDEQQLPWEVVLFFLLSIASSTGGYNKG
jgi:hypothetical protein